MENTSAPTPTKALTIAAPEKSWGQQHRLHAARSNAFDRLVNGETDEEIRAALANIEPSRSGLIIALAGRSEERRVGKECVRTWLTRGWRANTNKNKT